MGRCVTVVGNPGLDTLVMLGEELPDLRADGHFVRTVDEVGHAGAFVARACARLGHRTRILGTTGDDLAGAFVRRVLAEDGVGTELLFDDPAGTARSVNLITPDGRRTFFYDGGSHMTLSPPPGLVEAALDGAELVISTLANWARDVLPRARARGIPVAVDLQDVRDVHDPYRAGFIAAADVVFASAAHLPDPWAAARAWLAAGPAGLVVLGMGPRGAMLVPREGPARTVTPPPLDLPVVDTTGAGDSLAVGFLDGHVLGGLGLDASLLRGQVLARIVASDLGGRAGYDRARLQALTDALAGLP